MERWTPTEPAATPRSSWAWIPLLICLAAVPTSASAWGSAGHWAIGEIAWHLLGPEAEREVSLLLEPGPYDTLATAGYWADAHARLYRVYDDFLDQHYIDVDPAADTIDLARDCPEECVIRAIGSLAERLRDRSRYRWQRAQDFRFLVHFIEDVHQPLHVTHPDGRGGNRIDVTLFGEEMNLHAVWDWGLIEHRLAEIGEAEGASREIPAWRRWAYELRLAIDNDQRRLWAAATDPMIWATEGIRPAHELTFDVRPGQELGREYYETAMPVIERRIQMAAVRLAAFLDELFRED